MKKILLPTDYSQHAEKAIEFALHFAGAQTGHVECLIVHAYTAPATVPVYGYNPPGGEMPPLKKEEDYLGEYVDKWKRTFPGMSIKGRLQIGALMTVLTSLIEEEPDIDLVIMGTKGAGGMEEVLLGSNAARAAKGLTRPVLIIPPDAAYKKPERVAFATDFQKLGKLTILDPLRQLVRRFNPHFLTLHVLPEGNTPNAAKEALIRRLQAYFEGTRYSHYYLEDSDTINAIDRFIKHYKADWLVLVARERNFFESLFHKSVIRKMAFHTKIPLLVLK